MQPQTIFQLGVTLRSDDTRARQMEIARLASRLGYRHVWLPCGERLPDLTDLVALTDAARPASTGVILDGPSDGTVDWLATACQMLPDLLIEVPQPAAVPGILAAAGGPDRWRLHAYPHALDLTAAGCVIVADHRERLLDRLAAVRTTRDGAGLSPPQFAVMVAVTVSIGRTRSEANARALRDPAFQGVRHPEVAGLFGTLEQAQTQAMALAGAGADMVRATLADEHDIADLLAQLRSVAVGATVVLHARGGAAADRATRE
jgi:alkanesulfonate monooxygenase SsuD/methylene tetrahydromethanopterin reductase-like flavin-dependent oxidoreductase (luciferase family)